MGWLKVLFKQLVYFVLKHWLIAKLHRLNTGFIYHSWPHFFQEFPKAETPITFLIKGRETNDEETQKDNSLDTNENSENAKGDNAGEENSDNCTEKELAKGDNLETEKGDKCNEEDLAREEANLKNNGKGDNASEKTNSDCNNDLEEVATCVPILTYFDESCSRWRINNFGLTLKQTNNGNSLFKKIWDQAETHRKPRVCRILKDIDDGKIVTRAESTKDLEGSFDWSKGPWN